MPYHLDLPVPITFAVPAGWTFQGTSQDASFIADARQTAVFGWLVSDNLYRDPCHWQEGQLDPPVGPGVDDLVKALETLPGFRVTGPTSVTIGGLPAQRLAVVQTVRSSACDGGQMKVWSWEPTGKGSDFYGGAITVWVLADGPQRLVVFSWTLPGDMAAPPDIVAITSSIQFR